MAMTTTTHGRVAQTKKRARSARSTLRMGGKAREACAERPLHLERQVERGLPPARRAIAPLRRDGGRARSPHGSDRTTQAHGSANRDGAGCGRIVIAGCGPGAAEWVTPAVHEAVRTADVLVGSARLIGLFPASAAQKIPVGADIEDVLNRIAAIPLSRKVVVLVSGDPGLYSLARAVLARFGRTACRVVAGISSVQAAFARIGLTWEDARIVSVHEGPPGLTPRALAVCDRIAVLAGNSAAALWLREAVQALHKSHAIIICSDLTLPAERVEEVAPTQFDPARLPSRTIILFIRRRLLE